MVRSIEYSQAEASFHSVQVNSRDPSERRMPCIEHGPKPGQVRSPSRLRSCGVSTCFNPENSDTLLPAMLQHVSTCFDMFRHVSTCFGCENAQPKPISPSISPSISPCTYPSIHLSIYPSIHLSIYPYIYISLSLSGYLSNYDSFYFSIYLPTCICLSISIDLSIQLTLCI